MRYALAKNGVFRTVQGEGALLGIPMVFIRLAGCSVGCPECDTDYRVDRQVEAPLLAREVASLMFPTDRWVWITGGEPLDRDLAPLLVELRRIPGVSIALATSGVYQSPDEVDFLSVSPHVLNSKWVQRCGDELKIVPRLNGLNLDDLERIIGWPGMGQPIFKHHYVQPLAGDKDSLVDCLYWISRHPGWRMTVQAHKLWGLP